MAPRKKSKTDELFSDKEFSAVPELSEDVQEVALDSEAEAPVEEKAEEEPKTQEPDPKEEDGKEIDDKTKAEYLKIFDTIMFEGTYREVINMGTKYKVGLRNRTSKEDLEIAMRLDTMTFNTALAYQNQSSLLTLAYSLENYLGTDLTEMSYKDRYAYVCNINSQILIMLAEHLMKFESKVASALAYGQENF